MGKSSYVKYTEVACEKERLVTHINMGRASHAERSEGLGEEENNAKSLQCTQNQLCQTR
jgi:hypothetical protein